MGSLPASLDGDACRMSRLPFCLAAGFVSPMHLGQCRKTESPSAMFLDRDSESRCAGADNWSFMGCPPMA
eukprot:6722217-Heterocapsa_arctica.AAC.1